MLLLLLLQSYSSLMCVKVHHRCAGNAMQWCKSNVCNITMMVRCCISCVVAGKFRLAQWLAASGINRQYQERIYSLSCLPAVSTKRERHTRTDIKHKCAAVRIYPSVRRSSCGCIVSESAAASGIVHVHHVYLLSIRTRSKVSLVCMYVYWVKFMKWHYIVGTCKPGKMVFFFRFTGDWHSSLLLFFVLHGVDVLIMRWCSLFRDGGK